MSTGPQPADFTDVRTTNLAVVLRFVRQHAPCSRADIAASTGLNKATVSSLVADLIDRRLLRETGLTEHRIGRPATQLVLDGSPYAAVGMEVNAGHLTVIVVDLAGTRLLSWRRAFEPADATPGKAVSTVAALGRRALAKLHRDGRQILGLTVAVPGPIDATGTVVMSPSLGWEQVNLRDTLTGALGKPAFPVAIDNDATLAATAEYRYGPHAGTANLVYLAGQPGIGAGIIAAGRPLRGHRGYAGEIAHLQVNPAGSPCDCGRTGCLTGYTSVDAIIRRTIGEPVDDLEAAVDDLLRHARAGDAAVLAALEEAGHHLGAAVAALANLVDPEVVLLGGYLATLAPWLLPPAQHRLDHLAVGPGAARLLASTLGHDAAAMGAAAQVLDQVDAGRLPHPG
ncbi:ROK family transcriptional regulator [Rhizomonospora bruguierae]|uniref:ROK family transcriptional regulator n=1 Tax=Rhizomonospora bruguierae TaxID=1581705 RepID=UPI001BCC21F7|nr:ROK family transcriptional regulator [Micromonospora sp. NBRC 107566]